MAGPGGEDYWLVRFVLHRGLALIYLVAFLVAARQSRPLAGEDGHFRLGDYVEGRSFTERPSLFYVVPQDRVVVATAWLGVVLSLVALVAVVLRVATPAAAPTPGYLLVAAVAVVLPVPLLSVRPAVNMLSHARVMNTAFDPLHLVDTSGAFGSVTKARCEVVLEGTRDGGVTADTGWREYGVAGKPTDVSARPPQIAPSHHRLGWQLWFAAMSPSPRRHPWVLRLVGTQQEGDPAMRSLLASDPFGDDPPTHVRALRYCYRFTTPEECESTGDWWHRELVGTYVRSVSLDDGRGSGGVSSGSGV